METFLLILPLLACPLAMAAMAAGAWIWAKARQAPAAVRERVSAPDLRTSRHQDA